MFKCLHGGGVLLIRNLADQLSVELLIAAKGKAEEDHLFCVDRAAVNFIVSCIAELILRKLYPFHPAPNLYTRTPVMHTEIYSPSTLYVQIMVLSRSAYAILVNNWLDTFEKGVKIHVLIGDQ